MPDEGRFDANNRKSKHENNFFKDVEVK